MLLDAYGADDDLRRLTASAVAPGHEWSYDNVRAEVARGHPAFTEHWVVRQASARARRSLAWYHAHAEDLLEAAVGDRLG